MLKIEFFMQLTLCFIFPMIVGFMTCADFMLCVFLLPVLLLCAVNLLTLMYCGSAVWRPKQSSPWGQIKCILILSNFFIVPHFTRADRHFAGLAL